MKRLNLLQKELSLNLDLGVFDGSSQVESPFRPFLRFYIFASDANRYPFLNRQLKD